MKKIRYPNSTTIEVNINDFANGIDASTAENITKLNRSSNSYNFEFKDGVLSEGIGFEDYTIPEEINEGCDENTAVYFFEEGVSHNFKKLAHFKEFNTSANARQDKLFVLNDQNKPFYGRIITDIPVFAEFEQVSLSSDTKMANYKQGTNDAILFFNDTDKIYSWTNLTNPVHYESVPNIFDFCEYKNRTFAITSGERLTIRTEPTNMLTWVENSTANATFITFESERGYLNKLLTFNGYLFAIRDFGISRITWYDNDKYDVTHLLCSNSKIYSKTACVCGNKGIVLCKDGIYEFNNISSQKIDLKLNRLLKGVSNQNAVASYRNGIYYLACRLNFGDQTAVGCENEQDFKNNALICLDLTTNKYTIMRGVDIVDLCTIQYESVDKLVACFGGSLSTKIGQLTTDGLLFGQNQTKFWASPISDLGFSNKVKYIKELSLLSLYDIKVSVYSECESREFDIKGGNIISRVPVRIKGKRIGVSIKSTSSKAYISNLKIIAELIDNEYV